MKQTIKSKIKEVIQEIDESSERHAELTAHSIKLRLNNLLKDEKQLED